MTLGFLSGSRNFCKLLCVSCEVFVLHGYVWIHWVARSCTTTAYRWLFRDSQLSLRTLWSSHQIFCTKYGSTMASSARGPCHFCPLADLAILVFREVLRKNKVFAQIWTSPRRGLWRRFMWRTDVWVSAFKNSVIHEIFSEFLQPFREIGIQRVTPFHIMVFCFCLVWNFFVGLGNGGSPRSVRSTCELDRYCMESIPPRSLLKSHCRFDTIVVGEVDELEEDVGMITLLFLKVSLMLKNENWRKHLLTSLEPRLERSSPCYIVFRNRFEWDVVFDRWSIDMNVRFHRKAFRGTTLLAVFSRTFIVKNMSNSLTCTIASSCVCTSPLAVLTVVGLHDSSKCPFQLSQVLFCWSCALMHGSPRQTLFPQVSTLMQAGTHFPETRRMLLFHVLSIWTHIFGQLPRCFAGHLALATLSSWDRSSNFGALGLRWWGSPGQMHPSEGILVSEFQCDVQQPSWFLHVGLASACLCTSGE